MAFRVVHYLDEDTENEAMRQVVANAVTFLRHASPMAADIIAFLESRNPPVTIVVKDSHDATFNEWRLGNARGGGNGVVYWCSVKQKIPGKPSKEMGLMHELGHEYQLHSARALNREGEILDYYDRHGRTTLDRKKFYARFEDTIVLGIERPIAHEINDYLRNTRHLREGHHLYEPIRKTYASRNPIFKYINGPAKYVKDSDKPSRIEKGPKGWTHDNR